MDHFNKRVKSFLFNQKQLLKKKVLVHLVSVSAITNWFCRNKPRPLRARCEDIVALPLAPLLRDFTSNKP